MDKFAIIIVFYVIIAIVRLLSSAAKSQTSGKKSVQIRLKPEDLQRIARQRQQKKPTPSKQTAKLPPPLPDLPESFFEPPPDEEALAVDEELPEALEVRESDTMTPEVSNVFPASSSFFSENFGKHALQGVIWSEILRPPVSMRR